MTTLGQNATLSERLIFGEDVPREELASALALFEATLVALDNIGLTTDNPAALADELEALNDASVECNDESHHDYDNLRNFFEDCVDSLNARWPAATPHNQTLRTAICEAIARGDTEEQS